MLMEVKNNLKFIFLSIKYNITREMLNRSSFLMNVLLMILNNVSLIITWTVFFSLKPDFNGYTYNDQMLTISISAFTFGIVHFFFGGVVKISSYIEYGGLDRFLTKPKSPLFSIMTSKSVVSAFGDLLFGLLLFLIYFHSPIEWLLFIVVSFFSSLILLSYLIIINSITFWFIRFSDTVETLRDSFVSFSLYPYTIFNGVVKFMLYTLIPIGFAIYIPIELFLDFSILNLFILIGFSILNMMLATYIFHRGLRRYTSSNIAVVNV